jgi:serine/threonine-protein kinase
MVTAVWVLSRYVVPEFRGRQPERKMLVVLPFENLGSAEDEYFADGVTEEITARLAGIQALGVIARKSAIQYKETEKTIQQIGEELGVEYLLEGTIRWQRATGDQNQVRVTPQLIRISDGTHLWADVYQAELTDIFQVQSDIAEKVAEELGVALLDTERQAIVSKPTENLEAYRAYLRGFDLYWRQTDFFKENYDLAIQMFERAVELDPEFALAYANLSQVHSFMYTAGFDRSEERQALAKAAADRALELQPDLPDAHLALGFYHYWCHLEYDEALSEFAIAERGRPDDPRVLEASTFVLRRQGRYAEAVEKLETSFKLSPRDAELAGNIAYAYTALRDYPKALRYVETSIALIPDQASDYVGKALIYLLWKGDTKSARAILDDVPRSIDDAVYTGWFWLEMLDRDYDEALRRIDAISAEYFEDHSRLIPWTQMAGMVYRFQGNEKLARVSFDSARVILEREVKLRPDDYRVRGQLGIVYAGLGNKEDAVREGMRAVELLPITRDALIGPDRIEDLAVIYTIVGEYEAALDQIEYLLSIPCIFSVQVLRMDPRWDALRDHPRYSRIVRRFS